MLHCRASESPTEMKTPAGRRVHIRPEPGKDQFVAVLIIPENPTPSKRKKVTFFEGEALT
jgi:hypothetical protein